MSLWGGRERGGEDASQGSKLSGHWGGNWLGSHLFFPERAFSSSAKREEKEERVNVKLSLSQNHKSESGERERKKKIAGEKMGEGDLRL